MPTNTYPNPYAGYVDMGVWDNMPQPGDPISIENIAKIARAELAKALQDPEVAKAFEKRITALAQALELLGKQVEEHNRFLLTLQSPPPQPGPKWQCYCGWVGAISVCEICGRRGGSQ